MCILGKNLTFFEKVDGVGIVEHAFEFYLLDDTYTGLEYRSKHRCAEHGLVPARRVAWGGGSTGRRCLGCPLDVRVTFRSLILDMDMSLLDLIFASIAVARRVPLVGLG